MLSRTSVIVVVVATIQGCTPNPAISVDAHADASQLTPDATTDALAAANTIPITMVTLPNGRVVATVEVAIGGGAPFTAMLDTGSVGLRVITGTVPDTAWTVGTQPSSITYGSGVIASGMIATANVALGGISTTTAIAVEDITSVSCTAAQPNCPAAGVATAAFRFAGTFPAMLGVGLRTTPYIASPIAALGSHHQYTISLPPLGGPAGTITIDPDPSTIARFAATSIALPVRGAGFDDTSVPFCVNAFCAHGLLDTGQAAMVVVPTSAGDDARLGVPSGSNQVPPGTAVEVTIGGSAMWSFHVGATPIAGKDLIRIDAAGMLDNLGIAPYLVFDMFYDYAAGRIGIAPKRP